jgi:hypothetical protein
MSVCSTARQTPRIPTARLARSSSTKARSWDFRSDQIQRGSFVWGRELAYGRTSEIIDPPFPGGQYDRVIDLKARLDFAANRVLVYGVLGYSDAPFDDSGTEFDTKGFAAGIGADYAVRVGCRWAWNSSPMTCPSTRARASLGPVSIRCPFT